MFLQDSLFSQYYNPGLRTFLQNLSYPLALFISLLSWSLLIPVDSGGLWTFKNHFFHSLNSVSCLISMLVYPQHWESRSLVVPFRYCLGYALLQFLLQSSGTLTSLSGFIIQPSYPRSAGPLPFPGLQEQSRSCCDHCRDILNPHPHYSYISVLLGRKDQ